MSQNSGPVADSTKFSANELRAAIETLEELLGQSTVVSILAYLEKHGMALSSAGAQYSIAEIQTGLDYYFGTQMALFLLRHITKGLAGKLS